MTESTPHPTSRLRPTAMRIDPSRCQRGELCHLLAPEIGDGRDVPVTPDTLLAMAACPTGALSWREPESAGDDH